MPTKLIIKIMVKTPKIESRRLESLRELKGDSYAWTTKEFNKNIKLKKYRIVNEEKVFSPWKLIYKKYEYFSINFKKIY